MFKFYLDNILVPDPINWNIFTETLEHDPIIKGVLPKYEVKLNFNSGGYDYLYKRFRLDGFCQKVSLRIEQANCSKNFKKVLDGTIFIKDCNFNLNKCTVECAVEDNNYGARIYNNKSIKTFIDTTKSKNGVSIMPVTSTEIRMFRPVNGDIIPVSRYGYPVKDIFRFLIEFMSDGLVGFESDYMSSSQDFLFTMKIITGKSLRDPANPTTPQLSFEQLFKEINKKYPISFTVIKGATGKPTIKIENDDYFTSKDPSTTIADIEDMHLSFDDEVLYSSVRFGGPYAKYDPSIHHFGFTQFHTFKEEEYFFNGECNIDKVLDLKGDFIADTNIIEELVDTNTSNQSYDDNIFMIEVDEGVPGFARAQANPITHAAPYNYNETLSNQWVSSRQNFNGDLTLYLSGTIPGFRAGMTINNYPGGGGGFGQFDPPAVATLAPYIFVPFDDDFTAPNFDATGAYNSTLYRYYAPITGDYSFESSIEVFKDSGLAVDSGQYYKFYTQIRRYSASDVLLETTETISQREDFDGIAFHFANATFTLNSGDYVSVAARIEYGKKGPVAVRFIMLWLKQESFFRVIASPNAGGIYQSDTNKPYLAAKINFEYPISTEKWETITEDLSKGITVNHDGVNNRKTYIRKLTRNFSTSETKSELLYNVK